jgi:hypothetical protein
MSTPSGKPINPLDLSAYVSQKAREQAHTERFPAENADDLFRSPYAPRRADAGTPTQPVENDTEAHRSPYAPSPYAPKTQQQTRPAAEPDDIADRHTEDPFSRAPEGQRGPPPLDLRALDFEEPGARPFSNAPGGPDLPPEMAFEEVVKDHPIDLDAAASLQPAHPTGERYEPPAAAPHADEVMNDRDLERLEASLRWLQRQDTTTARMPRATPLAPVRGLPPASPLAQVRGLPPANPRERQPGGDVYGGRVPLSLEPQRMAPPPRGARHDSLRWPLRFLIASSVAAPVLYYLSVGWGPASEPTPSSQITAASPTTAVPPAASRGPREPVSARVQQDDVPTTLATRGDLLPQPTNVPPVSQQQVPIEAPRQVEAPQLQASQPPQPVQPPRALERETVARLPAAPPAADVPPASKPPVRTLSQDDIVLLIKQGEQFIAAGDVVTARIVFQRAAEAGDPNAAVALGATYDPTVLARLGVVGMGADVEKARSWYQKAESLGSPEAARRLKILANR